MAYIQESNLVPLDRPLIPGERVIRIGNTLVPASVLAAEKVQPPVKGLVFYHSFDGTSTAKSDVGAKTLSNPYGTITYTEAEGIRCAFFSSAGMSFSKIDDFVTGTPFSASIWFKGTSETVTASVWICSPGTSGRGDAGLYIAANTDTNKFTIGSAGTYIYSTADTFDLTQWHCLCCVSDGSTISFYVDGVPQISETLWNINPDSRPGGFGRTGQYDAGLTGYLAAARAYYRALIADEIAALASEFTPSAS